MWDIHLMKPAKFHPAVKPILKDFPEDVRREIGKVMCSMLLRRQHKLRLKKKFKLGKKDYGRLYEKDQSD